MADTTPIGLGDNLPHRRFDSGGNQTGQIGQLKNILLGVNSFAGDYPGERLIHGSGHNFAGRLPISSNDVTSGGNPIFFRFTQMEYMPGTNPNDIGNIGFPSLVTDIDAWNPTVSPAPPNNSGFLLRTKCWMEDSAWTIREVNLTTAVIIGKYPTTITLDALYNRINLPSAPGAQWQWLHGSGLGDKFTVDGVVESGTFSGIHGKSTYSGQSATLNASPEQWVFQLVAPGHSFPPVLSPGGGVQGPILGQFYFN